MLNGGSISIGSSSLRSPRGPHTHTTHTQAGRSQPEPTHTNFTRYANAHPHARYLSLSRLPSRRLLPPRRFRRCDRRSDRRLSAHVSAPSPPSPHGLCPPPESHLLRLKPPHPAPPPPRGVSAPCALRIVGGLVSPPRAGELVSCLEGFSFDPLFW